MRYLILHGYEGSGPDHWQTWLAGRLRAAGHEVAYPALPDPYRPRFERWLRVLDAERTPGDVVICHSAGCCLWLHHRARGGPPAARALLVAPPLPEPMLPAIAGFYPVPLAHGIGAEARVVCSDADPWCPPGATAAFAEPLGVPVDVLPGAGHINAESGFGPWPAAEAWAYGVNQGIDT